VFKSFITSSSSFRTLFEIEAWERSIRGCRAAVDIASSKTGGEDRVVLDAQTKI
jgi:hypothetical protein